MTWTYKCGHTSQAIITDNSIMTLSAYMVWKDSVGVDGDMSQCWKCWNKEKEDKS